MKVIYVRHDAPAWNVIALAARIAARLLEADFVEIPSVRARQRGRRVLKALPRLRRGEPVFCIAPEPVDLYGLIGMGAWWEGPRDVAAWVVDSWWHERIPAIARDSAHIDRFYVSEREDLEGWTEATGRPVSWLPQGTDALDRGSGAPDRLISLQRLGRQPKGWEDDDETAALATELGLTFRGRTPFVNGEEGGMTALLGGLAEARYVVAFSNVASPRRYTHPTREYLTGRWTDSLAAGAVVAGIAPRCASAHRLWPGAVLELGTTELARGLEVVAEHNRSWSPSIAWRNHVEALRTLDWRRRFAQVGQDFGIQTSTMDLEIGRLDARINDLEQAGEWVPARDSRDTSSLSIRCSSDDPPIARPKE